jgi:hypothetical protein
MLFNLSCFRVFPSKRKGEEDINCSNRWGPCFGGGNYSELCAYGSPYNGRGNCASHSNRPAYEIQYLNGRNMLTNKYEGSFTISELEVWEVTFINK